MFRHCSTNHAKNPYPRIKNFEQTDFYGLITSLHLAESIAIKITIFEDNRVRPSAMINIFVKVSQFLSWFFLKPLFHLRFRIKIKGRHHINRVYGPLIIIANHIGVYDSFLFRILPGFFTRLLPFRFMGVTKFHHPFLNFLTKIGVVKFVYSIFGVFVVTPGRGLEHGLKDAKRIIREGGIVVIFPEGRINKDGGILDFKRGAAALAITTGAPILPVAIKRVGQRLYANVGQLIHLNTSSTFEDGSKKLHANVVDLFENIK